tara:strand:- start:472 stop:924 length:453 start_codon:yes stop_codon:yes gene_type:complete
MSELDIKAGGVSFKAMYLTIAVPVLSAISGAIYFGYDAVKRFEIVEADNGQYAVGIGELGSQDTLILSRLQSLEQAMQDNDVRGLAPRLTEISTNMTTIMEQQTDLLDLRSKVEKAETITDNIGDKLDTYNTEITDLWRAFDEAVKNPLN